MKYSSLLLFLITPIFLSAMEQDHPMITLPSKQVLLERLEPIKEYSNFLATSTFIDKCAEKNKYAAEVFMVLGFEIEKHDNHFNKPMETFCLEMLKPKVVTLMLQDYPEAIRFLKNNNVLTELVTLPNKETLRSYLISTPFNHAADKTQLIQQLADTQKYPTEIFMITHCQIVDYVKKINKIAIAQTLIPLVPTLAKLILQKHPVAIQFLIEEELLKS